MESDISKYEDCQSKINYNNNSSSIYQDAQSKINNYSYLKGAPNKLQKSNSFYEDAQNKINDDQKINELNNNEEIDTNSNNNEKNFSYKEDGNQTDDSKVKDFPTLPLFENDSNQKGACCELPKCSIF